MTRRGLVFDLARVTVELASPLAIGSGGTGELEDRPCVVDCNGLPAIPGTSLAGVLRAQIEAADPQSARKGFGFQERDVGQASAIEVSWGQIHDSRDRPVAQRVTGKIADPLLRDLRLPVVRDHVRIDGFGAAADRGKYDESLVPRGARFTFELVVHEGSPVSIADLLAILASDDLRLGAGTRNGHGRLALVRARARCFDLGRERDLTAFSRLPRELAAEFDEECLPLWQRGGASARASTGNRLDVRLKLFPLDFLLVGRGEPEPPDGAGVDWKGPDLSPVREHRISWKDGRGARSTSPVLLLPGTAFKGALRHRTAFHAFRLRRQFALTSDFEGDEPMPPEIGVLFGEIKGSPEPGEEGQGVAGRVFVEDCWLETKPPGRKQIEHVSIDRFSGAPLDGHLFSEDPLYFGGNRQIELRMRIELQENEEFNRAMRALAHAVHDLCNGELSIGAASNRGHGYLQGPFPKELARWMS